MLKKLCLKYSLWHHFFSELQNSIIDTHTHSSAEVPLSEPVLCFCRICSYSLAWARLRSISLQDPRSLASPHSKRCFSLCLSFPSLFRLLSCALLSYRLSVHPFNLSVCPPVSSSGFLWKVWPEPVTPPSRAAELSLHPVPAVATPSSSRDLWPRRVWGPLRTMPGYFVLGGGCSVLETPGSHAHGNLEISGFLNWPRKIYFEFKSFKIINQLKNDYLLICKTPFNTLSLRPPVKISFIFLELNTIPST